MSLRRSIGHAAEYGDATRHAIATSTTELLRDDRNLPTSVFLTPTTGLLYQRRRILFSCARNVGARDRVGLRRHTSARCSDVAVVVLTSAPWRRGAVRRRVSARSPCGIAPRSAGAVRTAAAVVHGGLRASRLAASRATSAPAPRIQSVKTSRCRLRTRRSSNTCPTSPPRMKISAA